MLHLVKIFIFFERIFKEQKKKCFFLFQKKQILTKNDVNGPTSDGICKCKVAANTEHTHTHKNIYK